MRVATWRRGDGFLARRCTADMLHISFFLQPLISLYSFSLFLPTILKGIYPASDTARVQLLTVPPCVCSSHQPSQTFPTIELTQPFPSPTTRYIPASVLVIIIAFAADRLRWRGPFILMLLPISIVGYIMILVTDSNTVRYAAVFLIALGIYPCAPCILAM